MTDLNDILDAFDFDDRLKALRAEAGEHGDLAQVAICDLALAGDEEVREECAEVLLNN